jgi:uncharacterized protein YeaO (DUF488 family)
LPNNSIFNIWTVQISNWRLVREKDISLLDITVKSGVQAFAPSWDNLRAYKAGLMSQSEYTSRYYDKIINSAEQNISAWQNLTEKRSMALACYCRAGEYCHRHIFAPLAIAYLQDLGHQVVFHGELLSV